MSKSLTRLVSLGMQKYGIPSYSGLLFVDEVTHHIFFPGSRSSKFVYIEHRLNMSSRKSRSVILVGITWRLPIPRRLNSHLFQDAFGTMTKCMGFIATSGFKHLQSSQA